jgi:hypothetical protein
MNKASLIASAALASLALTAAPAFAQFGDVPSDHWAYESVDKLAKRKIVIGYPDGTYGGRRAMTRYEFAVAIARLLDQVGTTGVSNQNFVTPDQLSNYALKSDLLNYATKSDLAAYAKAEDVAALRKLVEEFRAELVALGVDVEAIKKRLDDLDRRVKAIEEELKRVRIGGQVNIYARGNYTQDATAARPSVRDINGFEVTGGANGRGNIFADTRVLHDVDLDIKAKIDSKTTADVKINYGNYLDFLGGTASFNGARSDRNSGTVAGYLNPGGNTALARASQDQAFTIWKAQVESTVSIPVLGKTSVAIGRIPMQISPYTLKMIDVDWYFDNDKTDFGDIPMDGGKIKFNLGPVALTGFAAKVDPIKFISNVSGAINGDGGYALYAGAAASPFATSNTVAGGRILGGLGANGRPVGSLIDADNGAMQVEQLAGGRVELSINRFGTIGGTYMVLAGREALSPLNLTGLTGLQREVTDDLSFNRVFVYGADLATNIFGFGVNASYTKSDTGGERLNAAGTAVNLETETKIDEDNYAWDASLGRSFGSVDLKGGYRYIAPFFGAPGYWGRIGAWFNPVDIKGFYGNADIRLGKALGIGGGIQFYEGTGDAIARGGLSEDDEITNYNAYVKLGLGSMSAITVGAEVAEYKVLPVGAASGSRVKPREIYYNANYTYNFNSNNSFRLGYQFIEWQDKNSGLDPLNGKGGVGTVQYRVKF